MRRSATLGIGLFAALSFVVPLASGQAGKSNGDHVLSNGNYSVKVDDFGRITEVPASGLTSTYGPRVALVPGFVEAWGAGYDVPTGRVEVVANGNRPDYAHRKQVQFVSFSQSIDGSVSRTKCGDLEIETTFSFDDATGRFVIGVELTNTGTTEMDMVMYTREWSIPGVDGSTFPADWEKDLPPAPAALHRLAWMPNNILPGQMQGATLALDPKPGPSTRAVDVPLRLWKGGSFPTGLDFGTTYGISFGDYDHDGYIDVFACNSRNLWRNLGGTDWTLAANLESYFPSGNFEYGAAFGDYNNDNLPDIGTEPRGNCVLLLKNLGNATFDEVAGDPNIVDVQPCNAETETNSYADTDGDGNIDLFFPTYPPWIGSTGNWFLYNKGPVGTNGEYTFHEASAEAGLDNPPLPTNRPEGAEFCDTDFDGDVDLYSNNTIYRNISTPGTPLFEIMSEAGSGVVFSNVLDEGAGFLDYDMDGDMDLCIAFCDSTKGVRMFENQGDGMFVLQGKGIFDSFNTGLCLGLSFEDWDNDGDVDVTTSEVFRRNQWQETGTRHFTVATHNLPPGDITDATPAWGDFDKDGDLDTALGNWGEHGRLFENYTYDSTTPLDQRRYVRVKAVRDSPAFDDGLETEYGAQVTVRPTTTPNDVYKRTRVVATSGGYLNQNEYTLHFALPPDPDPSDPAKDLNFEVTVDFKGASSQGTMRVDRHVNPVLGDVSLAQLTNREIVVYRSGRVKMNGCDFAPAVPMTALTTTTGGLAFASTSAALPDPVASPGSDWFVGIEVSTANATAPVRVEEIVLDGQLDSAVDCNGTLADCYFWDVTDPSNPTLAVGGLKDSVTRPRNHRSYLPVDATLEPGRTYRVACRVTKLRTTPITAPVTNGALTTNGGLSFQDTSPCSGAGVVAAALNPNVVYLALRFRAEPSGAWADLGHALAGTTGVPVLAGSGDLRSGSSTTLTVTNALANAPAYLVIGFETMCLPFADGVIVPEFTEIVSGLATDANGTLALDDTWPDGINGGVAFYFQGLIADDGGPHGFAFTNALSGTTSY